MFMRSISLVLIFWFGFHFICWRAVIKNSENGNVQNGIVRAFKQRQITWLLNVLLRLRKPAYSGKCQFQTELSSTPVTFQLNRHSKQYWEYTERNATSTSQVKFRDKKETQNTKHGWLPIFKRVKLTKWSGLLRKEISKRYYHCCSKGNCERAPWTLRQWQFA